MIHIHRTGAESGRSTKNKISDIYANKTVFQSVDGASALNLSGGVVNIGDLSLRTISKFGS